MFRHVLVPIDLSDRHRAVLDAAAAIAVPSGARVTVLHVTQRIDGIPTAELQPFYARLAESARRRVDRAVRPLVAAGVRVRVRLVVGDPAAEILRAAKAGKADCIVLGSHRLGRAPGTGLGTTSYKVGILCACPVLLVK